MTIIGTMPITMSTTEIDESDDVYNDDDVSTTKPASKHRLQKEATATSVNLLQKKAIATFVNQESETGH